MFAVTMQMYSQPRAHLRPHSERIIPSVTVDMSMTRRQVSTTSKAGTITPKSAGLFPPMSSSPPARAFSGITHMRIAGITLYAGLTHQDTNGGRMRGTGFAVQHKMWENLSVITSDLKLTSRSRIVKSS